MTKKSSWIVAGAAVAMMTSGAMAQALPQMPRRPPSTPEQQRRLAAQRQLAMQGYREQLEAQREKRLREAGVSAAQQAQMAKIGRKYDGQMQKLQLQMQALMMKSQREQMAILTPAQRQKLMPRNAPAMRH